MFPHTKYQRHSDSQSGYISSYIMNILISIIKDIDIFRERWNKNIIKRLIWF